MLQKSIIGFFGLALTTVVLAADSKPQWQRMLAGENAKQAAGLEKRIQEAEKADQCAEAIQLHEELLALRTTVQGNDHWETLSEKWALAAAKKVATLPPEQRAGWRKARRRKTLPPGIWRKSQYAQALPKRQERLKWCRQVLEEDHPETAKSYLKIAANLEAQAKTSEANAIYQQALNIHRKTLGEDHPDTAFTYDAVGMNLNVQGKLAEAGPLLQKGLLVRRNVLGDDHAHTSTSYSHFASNLQAQGKYAEALPLFQRALDIRRKLFGEESQFTASTYNNLAALLKDQGKYAEAEPLYQKAMDIVRKVFGENHPTTAATYNNGGINFIGERKFAEGEALLQKSLDIKRKALGENDPSIARTYANIAGIFKEQGKYVEAEELVRKALNIERDRLGEDNPSTATSYYGLAIALNGQGKHAEAEPMSRRALDIRRKVLGENHRDTAGSYRNHALSLYAQGKYAPALEVLELGARSYEAARLDVSAAGLDRAAYAAERTPYPVLVAALCRAGRGTEAWAAMEADLARGLLDAQAVRRGLALTPDEQRKRDAWQSQQSALDTKVFALVRRPQRSPAQEADLQRLIQQRQELEKSIGKFAAELSRREVAALAKVQSALTPEAAFIAWIDVSDGGVEEHWGCVVRAQGEPRWERLPGSGPEGKWTADDGALTKHFREKLIGSASGAEVEGLAHRLHSQRLAPLSQHLGGARQLFVAPVNVMAGIPLESLTDQYTVCYMPSGTYLANSRDQKRSAGTGLLAVGDPEFLSPKNIASSSALPPGGLLISQVVPQGNAANARLQVGDVLVTYAGEELTSADQLGNLVAAKAGATTVVVTLWREEQTKLAQRELSSGPLGAVLAKVPAREAIEARRNTDRMLAKLTRGNEFAELPGTQVEIGQVAGLFDPRTVTTLTRADANEQRLDALRKAGALQAFRYLHFATHGKADTLHAFDSSLMLTRPTKQPEPRDGEPYLDGRLTAAEVLEYWKLDADLVTLSACDSGLGREGGGDGLLGFGQAFLLAGSRAVCLSLWEVDDSATALLMDRFYRNLLGKREDGAKPMGKAAALQEAKQWLRTLSTSAALLRLGTITQGIVRGERPARELMRVVPQPKDVADSRPYAHPRYWAAFVLIGDPE